MYHWLGWVFFVFGVLLIILEIVLDLRKRLKVSRAVIPEGVMTEIIKKLPWMVVLGLIFIYLGMYIIGVPVPISITVGSPMN
jgi:D-alanyl-lipoteichoic acid acyltransferase DltB (MBOAT superfamily)